MTSIANINRWRRRRLHPADTLRDEAPPAERTQTASRKGFVVVMLKTIRLTGALAVILAIEIGDFLSVKIGRVR
jgi:hypothetical protein